ncbi:MAG: virulence protein [Prevotellaceae bacterium]|jgi:virulence-associated protein VapD|nr:virulence protein [Prevotellaceae bacterium]
MFAIAFDMVVADLQKHYGSKYHRAYHEIRKLLKRYTFEWVQGSTYLTAGDDMRVVFDAITALSEVDWFAKSVRDVRAFKVENWSDFTASVKRRISPR